MRGGEKNGWLATTTEFGAWFGNEMDFFFFKMFSVKSIVIIQPIGADQNDLRLHLDAFRGGFHLVEVVDVLSAGTAALDGYVVSPRALGVGEGFFQPNEIPVLVVVFAGSPHGVGLDRSARTVHARPLVVATDD